MEVADLLLAAAIICLGSMVQTAFGFGMAVVAAPLLVLIHPTLVPGPIVMAAMVQCMLMAWQNRKSLDGKGLGSAFIGRIPGSIAGAVLLALVSAQWLSIAVGVVVLLGVVFSLGKFKLRPTPKSMFWASVLSGFFGSSTSVGGPPMALLLQHEKASAVRGNLAGYFIYGCVVSLIVLAVIGRFGWQELYLSCWFVSASVIGFFLCRWLPVYRLGDNLRPVILGICTLAALLAIGRGMFV